MTGIVTGTATTRQLLSCQYGDRRGSRASRIITSMVTRIHKGVRGHLYITEWRESIPLSVEQLAARVGVSRQTVFRWEKSQRNLTPDKIAWLAEALGIPPQRLWELPSRPSLDAELQDATPEQRQMVVDIARRIMGRAS